MEVLKISVLGPLQVFAGERNFNKFESNKVRALFAYLVMEMERPHGRETLAGMFWPETSTESALANLRYALADLRKVIQDEKARLPYLFISRESLQFNANSDFLLDAVEFQRLINTNTIENLKQALALYRGDFLEGFPAIEGEFFEEWLILKREQFRQQAIEKLQALASHHEERCEYQQALSYARRQIELEPWLEEAHQQLMRLLALDGQRSAALAQFETCRRMLDSEMSIEPSQETIQLYESIRAGKLEKVSPLLKREAPAPGTPPFKGLQYFDETDIDLFFGRETLVSHLVDQIHSRERTKGAKFLAIIGASGSGKSSLVRAGLIPALKRSGTSRAVVITPTEHPLESLSSGLKNIGTFKVRSLLFVDQFEELFTLCQSKTERQAFIRELLHLSQEGNMLVIVTLRADFYAACAPYENLRKSLSQNQEYIGPMIADELRRAIEEPARRNGWLFEPGLTDVLLHDIGADGDHLPEPGALPLLSHALLETWHRRSGRMLTLAGYAESGKIHQAITQTAETVFIHLSLEEQGIARNIFLRLTDLGDGSQETRRRAALSELIPPPGSSPNLGKTTRGVLRTLSDARLVITTDETAEVAHEALIREWNRLHEWLAENREGLRLHRNITESAREWDRQGRDKELVYRSTRLGQALEWANDHRGELNLLEWEFLKTSQACAEQEEAEREAQRQRELESARKLAESERQRAEQQAQTNRKLRAQAITLLIAFVAAIILATTAVFLEQKARREANIARSNELAAASISNLDLDPELSILLALQALSATDTRQAEEALHRAVQASRIKYTLTGHTDEIYDMDFSPDGTRLASASLDHTARIWSVSSGEELLTLAGHTDQVWQIEFSPDGQHLATASMDGTAKIWDAVTGQVVMTLTGHAGGLYDIKYSPDGKYLATVAADKSVRVWEAESGREQFAIPEISQTWVSFSPEGSRIATGYEDGKVRVWDIIKKQSILTLAGGHDSPVVRVSFSPDGDRLVSDDDKSVVVWDLRNGEQLVKFSGYFPAFDPKGSQLVAWTADTGELAIYDASNYQKNYTLAGHKGGGNGTIFNQDGSLLATPNADGTTKVWDMANGRELFTLSGHAGGVDDATFSPGCVSPPESPFAHCGSILATASRDKTIKIWDVTPAGNREIITVPGFVSLYSPVDGDLITGMFSADRTTVTYHTWNMATVGQEQETTSYSVTHPAPIWDGGANADATLLGTVSMDGTVKILDRTTGREILTFIPPEPIESALDISIPASGPCLTAISQSQEMIIWDVETGEKVATLPIHPGPETVVRLSPDGSQIVVLPQGESTATLWSLPSGEKQFDLAGHTQPPYTAAFSLDGKRLVTAGMDGTAIVWNSQTGKSLLRLSGSSASIWAAVFSRDGTRLATGGFDGVARIWDVSPGSTTGQELLSFSGYSSFINTLDFSPDDRYLAASIFFGDSATRVYALQIEDLIALARSRLTRSLTLEECQKYLHQTVCP